MTEQSKSKIENLDQQGEEELTPEQAERAQGGVLTEIVATVRVQGTVSQLDTFAGGSGTGSGTG
jgi:hypothetical protein